MSEVGHVLFANTGLLLAELGCFPLKNSMYETVLNKLAWHKSSAYARPPGLSYWFCHIYHPHSSYSIPLPLEPLSPLVCLVSAFCLVMVPEPSGKCYNTEVPFVTEHSTDTYVFRQIVSSCVNQYPVYKSKNSSVTPLILKLSVYLP